MFATEPSFAIAVARRASELGLIYSGEGVARPIAVALPAEPEAEAAVRERAGIAKRVLSGLVKVGEAGLRGELGAELRWALLAGLSPLERKILATARTLPPRIVTARADILLDPDGGPHVVEMNTTIPAMQGYSDISLRAWTERFIERSLQVDRSVARRLADEALAREGTNADDLLDALVSAYALDDGRSERPSIALVHRRGDSQVGELNYLAARFRDRGHHAETVVVDDLSFGADGRLQAGTFRPEVVYRHVFARLVQEGSAFAQALAEPTRHYVYNPVTAHLEQKATLAALSEVAANDTVAARVGLDDDERDVAARHVPWTRILEPALVDMVAETPDRYVIKRSWDFGGKSVVVGDTANGDWRRRVGEAADVGGWVVQERVVLRPREHLVALGNTAAMRAVFVDASAYTSHATLVHASGSVRRASTSPIVNIQSGGGVMPVVTESLLRDLASLQRPQRTARAWMNDDPHERHDGRNG